MLMKKSLTFNAKLLIVMLLSLFTFSASATSAEELTNEAQQSLDKLIETSPVAKNLAVTAKGVLVFPDVLKAGLIIGGQYGEGALTIDGKVDGFYNTVAASYGLQAGAQAFGYAMFFMNEKSLAYLKSSSGWEVGVGPNIVVVDKGAATSLTTTTTEDDIYVFFFDQKGLMAGLGVQGSKITEFTPDDK